MRQAGRSLYGHAVAAAREPLFYTELAVADTLDGRFDMICLLVALLTRRLAAFDPALAQSVFDAMFLDLDGCLREAGVGDPGVSRRVRAMGEAFRGRARAYGEALGRCDEAGLSEALLRNIWRGRDAARPQARRLLRWVLWQQAALAAQDDAALAAGGTWFAGAALLAGGQA